MVTSSFNEELDYLGVTLFTSFVQCREAILKYMYNDSDILYVE